MGNLISSTATIDGHPIAPVLQRARTSITNVIRVFLWPFTSVLALYTPPVAEQVEKAAGMLPSAERKHILEAVAADRSDLANLVSLTKTSFWRLVEREEAMAKQINEIEKCRFEYSEKLKAMTGDSVACDDPNAAARQEVTITGLRKQVDEFIPHLSKEVTRSTFELCATTYFCIITIHEG